MLSGDFIDDLGRKPSDILPGLSKGVDSNGFGNGKYSSDSPRNNQLNSNLPSGKVKLNLIKTKDLIKAGLIGKSDPYAIPKYGRQLRKTKTIKNTLEPQWNHEAEFDVPDGVKSGQLLLSADLLDGLETNNECLDKEGIDTQVPSRVRERSLNRVLPHNRRKLAVKPDPMHRSDTRKVGSVRFNHLLIFPRT